MSIATSEPTATKFLNRFEHVCALIRRFQVALGLCWTLLAAVLGFTLLTTADFLFELPWGTPRPVSSHAASSHWPRWDSRSSRRYAGGRSREPPSRSRAASHSLASGFVRSSSMPDSHLISFTPKVLLRVWSRPSSAILTSRSSLWPSNGWCIGDRHGRSPPWPQFRRSSFSLPREEAPNGGSR